jgi:hypothetical protein
MDNLFIFLSTIVTNLGYLILFFIAWPFFFIDEWSADTITGATVVTVIYWIALGLINEMELIEVATMRARAWWKAFTASRDDK